MKKIVNLIKAFFEKRPLLSDIIKTTLGTLLFTSIFVAAIFLILWATDTYSALQAALDLKFNSPVLLTVISVFGILCLVCWTVGALMYFHKYKRNKTKTDFYKELSPIFTKKQ